VRTAEGIIFPFHAEIDRHTLKGAFQDADVDLAEFLRTSQIKKRQRALK
jgi:hypothetical protein